MKLEGLFSWKIKKNPGIKEITPDNSNQYKQSEQVTNPFFNMPYVKMLQSWKSIWKVRRGQYPSAQMKVDYADALWKIKTKY